MPQANPSPAGNPQSALVLGGGGAYGVVQAAYIVAAMEAGFWPSMIVGTSVGSLNGAWIALHPDEPAELLRIWLALDRLKLVRVNPVRMAARLVRHPMGMVSNDIVPWLIREHMLGKSFDDAKIPLAVVATNLSRGEKRVFREGDLLTAIMASTAIPGVFDPVEIDGDLYVDGGLTASVDLATALAMGAAEILAIDLTPPPSLAHPKTVVGVLRQSLGILAHASAGAMEECVAHTTPVRVIQPDLSASSPWQLDDSAGSVAHNLTIARKEMRDVLHADGSVRPHDGIAACELPGQPKEPINMRRYFHLRGAGRQ
jgi:NTE family protein